MVQYYPQNNNYFQTSYGIFSFRNIKLNKNYKNYIKLIAIVLITYEWVLIWIFLNVLLENI